MKLNIGLAAALAGCAAAARTAADVFILDDSDASPSATLPTITPSIARLLLLQRIAPAYEGPSVNDIPEDADLETVVSLLNQFGPTTSPLFDERATTANPDRVLVMVEGLVDDDMDRIGRYLRRQPSFRIVDPPSSSAHDELIDNDLHNTGVTGFHKRDLIEDTNPSEEGYWGSGFNVVRFDAQKKPEALPVLQKLIPEYIDQATSGKIEVTVILFPVATGEPQPSSWSDENTELRRRQAELVISSLDEKPPVESGGPTSPAASSDDVFVISSKQGKVPACFDSEDSCNSGTNNCSDHGKCQNKYAKRDGSAGATSCWTCHCLSTPTEKGGITHWAGKTCSKKDVSTPFWLFAGFTLVMVGIVSLAIGMLFSVGEEQLPGVIGAGVSRSK